MNLQSFDLNLLMVFEVLMRERSVTKTADRLGLSQPAVSYALNRLRKVLSDPLFVRVGRAMQPTPMALQMVDPVTDALDTIRSALEGKRVFEPSNTGRQFNILMSYVGEAIYLPKLTERLSIEAPGASLQVGRLMPSTLFSDLAFGDVDCAIGNAHVVDSGLCTEPLFEDRIVCVARKKHPRVHAPMTLDMFLAEGHVVAGRLEAGETKAMKMVDDTIAREVTRLGGERRAAVYVKHSTSIPLIVAASELVACVPSRVAATYEGYGLIDTYEMPFQTIVLQVHQIWHRHSQADVGASWLRGIISDVFKLF